MAFKKGQSGNPAGRPKGSSHASTVRKLMSSHSESLVNKAVELALEGDTTALRICIDRLCPVLKAQELPIELGGVKGSLSQQGRQVISALANGQVGPGDTAAVLNAIGHQAKIVQHEELEQRIHKLEERINAKKR